MWAVALACVAAAACAGVALVGSGAGDASSVLLQRRVVEYRAQPARQQRLRQQPSYQVPPRLPPRPPCPASPPRPPRRGAVRGVRTMTLCALRCRVSPWPWPRRSPRRARPRAATGRRRAPADRTPPRPSSSTRPAFRPRLVLCVRRACACAWPSGRALRSRASCLQRLTAPVRAAETEKQALMRARVEAKQAVCSPPVLPSPPGAPACVHRCSRRSRGGQQPAWRHDRLSDARVRCPPVSQTRSNPLRSALLVLPAAFLCSSSSLLCTSTSKRTTWPSRRRTPPSRRSARTAPPARRCVVYVCVRAYDNNDMYLCLRCFLFSFFSAQAVRRA